MEIVVVDDSKSFRTVIQAILSNAGYEQLSLFDSPSAVIEYLKKRAVENTIENIGLILMDIEMPELNGIEAVKLLKADTRLEDIPVIMVTGSETDENIEAAFAAGAIDYINKPLKPIELKARVRSVLTLKSERDIRKLKERELMEANERLHQLSITDGLTGLFNRRHFSERFSSAWRGGCRREKPLSIILMDVDFFKAYNDNYGHIKGDKVLETIGSILMGMTRRPTDAAARYGGEEFVLMLEDTDLEGAADVVARTQTALYSKAIEHEYSRVSNIITMSIGIATLVPRIGTESTSILKAADDALYQAKSDGKNCVRRYVFTLD